jgi:DnaJ-class molecular chaperone
MRNCGMCLTTGLIGPGHPHTCQVCKGTGNSKITTSVPSNQDPRISTEANLSIQQKFREEK